MRNQTARVILGACVLAAAAGAQARFSSSSDFSRPSYSSLGVESNPSYASSIQDPQDYSMLRIFKQTHGDFMNRRERLDPNVEISTRMLGMRRVGDEPGSFDLLGYNFDAEIPALITTEAYVLIGAYYDARRYLTSSNFGTANNVSGFGDETIVATGLRLGFGWFLTEDVLFELEANPGVWSDLEDGMNSEYYDSPGMALFTVRASPSFFFKVGARYNQIFEDAPWLPVLGFSWEVTDGFRIDVLAPERAEMSFWPSASTGFLVGAQVYGGEYHVHTSLATGKQRDDLQVQEVIVYGGLMQRMNDHLSLTLRGGIVVAGDYDLTTGGAGFDRVEGALDQALFAEISLGITW
jgi:hypothetical protein